MSRRTTGMMLIVVSAILFCTRYLTAAIFGSSHTTWSKELFIALLQYVGPGLIIWSLVALVFGLSFLIWAEFETKQINPHS